MVPAVRIENRAQLIYLLTEAAEIEHNVLCCYLFAQFSMKDSTEEGLTAAQLEKVRDWRATIGGIAVQEMLHLATACNLLTAVGGAPQLRRPNLPTSPRAYPSAFELRLVPFGLEAVDQFVFLERPEYIDAESRPRPSYRDSPLAVSSLRDAFSGERDYDTVQAAYAQAGVAAEVQKFIDDMPAFFARADLVLCRSGASTVAEIAAAGKPAVFVPFPLAADDHQRRNAEALEREGAAVLVEETKLDEVWLVDTISALLEDPARLRAMSEAARAMAHPNAAKDIADLAAKVAEIQPLALSF